MVCLVEKKSCSVSDKDNVSDEDDNNSFNSTIFICL